MRESSRQQQAVEGAAEGIQQLALHRVQTPDGRVRVEDYLTALGAITGEAAVVSAGIFDIENPPAGMTPGAPVFGDPINRVLTGDKPTMEAAPAESVAGVLRDELIPAVFPATTFPPLAEIYRHVAEHVGEAPWGQVAVSVPADNRPTVVPLQVAFELRDALNALLDAARVEPARRYIPAALALARGLAQVKDAIKPEIGIRLALEITFGVAKLTPVPKTALAEVANHLVGGSAAT